VRLVGFIIRIYQDSRSPERQISLLVLRLGVIVIKRGYVV